MNRWPPKIKKELSEVKSAYGLTVGRQISLIASLYSSSRAADSPLRETLNRLRMAYLVEGTIPRDLLQRIPLGLLGQLSTAYSGVSVGLYSGLLASLRSYLRELETRLGLIITGGFGGLIFLTSLGAVGLIPRILFVALATLFSLAFLLLKWEEIGLPPGGIRASLKISPRRFPLASLRSGGSSHPRAGILSPSRSRRLPSLLGMSYPISPRDSAGSRVLSRWRRPRCITKKLQLY